MEKKALNRRIGKNIKKARVNAKLHRKELAAILGISFGSMINIEQGAQACSIDKLVKIQKITGISIQDLVMNK